MEKTIMKRKDVFIVHGHDTSAFFELKDFLLSLGLNPILLFQQDDLGMTIIEKFEYYAATCEFAFILLTPDDKLSSELNGTNKWRSRQNVIMEMGWFMSKLGRSRVVMLHKGNVELPSDILGILYLSFDKSILEASEKIRQRLKGQGVIS
jgi:predicted nucleotide-binding protein